MNLTPISSNLNLSDLNENSIPTVHEEKKMVSGVDENKNPFECGTCQAKFLDEDDLKGHIFALHKDEQKKMYRGKDKTHLLVVIDDFQQHLNSISSSIEALFTQICHHTRTSVIVTLQNPTQPGSKALTAINSMKCNLTHAIVMPSLACGATYALLEMRHNPFRSYAAGAPKNGSRISISLEEVEKFTKFPYLLFDFNTWNKTFTNQYPERSMICGELGEHVGALLFKADNLLCKMGHPLPLP